MAPRNSLKDTILFIFSAIVFFSSGIYSLNGLIHSTKEWRLLRDEFVKTNAVTIASESWSKSTIISYRFTATSTGREYIGEARVGAYPDNRIGAIFRVRYYPSDPNIVWREQAFQTYWRTSFLTAIGVIVFFSVAAIAVHSLLTGSLWLLNKKARVRR